MRNVFCSTLLEFSADPRFIFLSGDLGFKALEPLKEAMGERFINAGVAEQNMVAVACGLARTGLRPWVYSIAPFLYARAFEQIRNDVCLHDLPVVLVGNGGGYGYGVMGSTHHALEDYGVLLSLPNLRAYVPAFDPDLQHGIRSLMRGGGPAYVRLGLSEQPSWLSPEPYAVWRRVLPGQGPTVVFAGPLVGGSLAAIRDAGLDADVWLVSELPVTELPAEFLLSVRNSGYLLVVEEHVPAGGLGQMLSPLLLAAGVSPLRFRHRAALGYVSGLYGSQQFHRVECGLDPASIVRTWRAGARRMMQRLPLEQKIKHLQGPILVLGASGFVGANVMHLLFQHRHDVYGTATRLPAWRLEGLPAENVTVTDLLIDSNLDHLLRAVEPRTIIDCVAYGAYSFETDSQLIYQTNFNLVSRLLARLESRQIAVYVHAGSSSEYGYHASGPSEDVTPAPNSHYAVSKASASSLIYYYGKKNGFPCANLRLYSLYGPLEDSSRLIPNLVRRGLEGRYPEFVHPDISRDFIYVDDAVEAFIDVAMNLTEADYGESFNVGTGDKTSIAQCAALAKEVFAIQADPEFSMPNRAWDVEDWYANTAKIRDRIGWEPRTKFRDGLVRTVEWFRTLADPEQYFQSTKRFGLDTKHSVSAVIACYKDNMAIPIMYERLRKTFTKLNIDYEIIFVNDGSPDDSEEVIRTMSRNDRRVRGISHSRNFGSQAAFRSGMEIASKNACVLLDGDLQDPPELIEVMVTKWREGYDVVYGRRVQRQAPVLHRVTFTRRVLRPALRRLSPA